MIYGISALLHLNRVKNLLIAILFISATPADKTIADLSLPAGYQRVAQPAGSFGAWLRQIPLKKDNAVYLYNGEKKVNQLAQFAVLDIPVGKRDLQQCADAVMRLYAEYQYSRMQYQQISFKATDGTLMDYSSWMKGYRFVAKNGRLQKQLSAAKGEGRTCFESYMQTVFSYAGTLSLSKELQQVTDIKDIMPGYVFIRGGSPGHAVIVADVAINVVTKEKIFLLAQSYMPAQDIHILKNPVAFSGPWYTTDFSARLYTPEWIFQREELKRF
jgi:hypothetical protein